LRVPRPPRGYWARLAVDRAPARPELPNAQPGDELEWCREGEGRRGPRPRPKPPAGVLAPVAGAGRMSRWKLNHGLVLGVRDLFAGGRVSDRGYLKPNKKRLVDVFTTEESLDRALNAASGLFLALEDRGHRVVLAPKGE